MSFLIILIAIIQEKAQKMNYQDNFKPKRRDELIELAVDLKVSQFDKKSFNRFGHWSEKQTLKHYLFVYHHKDKFESKSMRKSLRVFKLMSQFIKTRNPSQCRTHHQKILGKEGQVKQCLNLYINEHPSFLKQYEKVQATLQLLEDYDFCQDNTYNKKEEQIMEEKVEKLKEQEEIVKIEYNEPQGWNQEDKNMLYHTMPSYGETSMENDWRECHEMYMQWVRKLKQLIEMPYE